VQDLTPKREQHAAAMTYLDTGTLALADVLALLDDEPAEEGSAPNGTRRRRASLWGATTAALTAALTLAVVTTAPRTAEAATPFDNPTWRVLTEHSSWHCSILAPRKARCAAGTPDQAEVVAYEGPGETVYAVTHRNARTLVMLYSHDSPMLPVWQAHPDVYPNRQEGAGWAVSSTNPCEAALLAALLP
jgi:hypothetical protein